jgi:CRISPR-associated protein Cas5d
LHENIVEFEVHGDYALFSDPITRTGGEKCTYLIPTYEAIKGVLHSIYWKPTIIWIIDSVRVMNQIQTVTKGIRPIRYNDGKNELSFYTYLKDCRYQVKAHFIWNENRPELGKDRNENKHHNVAKRMIEKGGKRDVFLGCRECQAYVEPSVFGQGKGFYDNPDSISEVSFGLMFHGMTYADEAYSQETKNRMTARFWYSVMRNGYVDFPNPKECPVNREIHSMSIKPFGEQLNNFSCLTESEEVQ